MVPRSVPDWSHEDDDLTRTVRLGADREITDVMLDPRFAVATPTEELPVPAWVSPTPLPPAPSPAESFPSVPSEPFASAPSIRRLHTESNPLLARAPFDSDTGVSTWRKTVPALRRMMGLPVVPGWRPTPLPRPRALAPVAPVAPVASTAPGVAASRLSPLVSIPMAVGLVAMVLIAIVGVGSRAREAARLAHTRVVSATAPDGAAVTDGQVFVDGSAQCASTPCELELTPGVHWITVRAPGFETPPSRSVHAGREDEPTSLGFALTPSSRALPVEPAAALAPSAAIPPELARVPAPAAAPVPPPVAALPAPAAVPTPMVHAPAPAPPSGARLNVNSIPASNVLVDGRPAGQTPVMGLKLKPGPHTVVLIGPDGQRAVRSATVMAGKTATVAVRF